MNTLLFFLAPPLLGAFIGYVTNYVAIRMLFRPLKPWRLLGFRLPMTPGVIPKKRQQLAQNIGKMVGEHLLTSEDVRKALTEEGFQQELQGIIEGRLADLMHRELGPVSTLVPERFSGYFQTGVRILQWRLSKHLHNHLASDAFAEKVAEVVHGRLEEFLAADLDAYLPAKERDRLGDVMEKAVCRLFVSPWFGEWVEESIDRWFERVLREKRSPADLLPEDFLHLILDRVERETPQLLGKIAARLEEREVQDRIAGAVGSALRGFIDSLGPVAAMLGSFVNPEVVDRKIRDYFDEKNDQLTGFLFDETVQHKTAELLRERIGRLLATPVADLLKDVDSGKIKSVREGIGQQAVAALRRPEIAGLGGDLLRKVLADHAGWPLREILAELVGEEGSTGARDWTTREIVALLRSARTRRLLDEMIAEVMEKKILTQPLGSLAAFLPKEVQKAVGAYLLEQISNLLIREVPGLIDSLNIQQVVAKKVDSLDLLRLEGLILGIMQEQFKYINIFGGLLGFLIGSLNLLLALVR
jgi:uncharacterized membrane protein YheB (UPF0754 family)